VTTRYGKDADSRIADPADSSRVFSWLICESYDDKGNGLVYEYQREDSARIFEDAEGVTTVPARERNRTRQSRSAITYLKRIKYGNPTPNRDGQWNATDPTQISGWLFELVFDYDEGHCEDLP